MAREIITSYATIPRPGRTQCFYMVTSVPLPKIHPRRVVCRAGPCSNGGVCNNSLVGLAVRLAFTDAVSLQRLPLPEAANHLRRLLESKLPKFCRAVLLNTQRPSYRVSYPKLPDRAQQSARLPRQCEAKSWASPGLGARIPALTRIGEREQENHVR